MLPNLLTLQDLSGLGRLWSSQGGRRAPSLGHSYFWGSGKQKHFNFFMFVTYTIFLCNLHPSGWKWQNRELTGFIFICHNAFLVFASVSSLWAFLLMRLYAPSVTSSWPTHQKHGWHNTKTTIITWEVINQGRAHIRTFLSFCVNCRFCRLDVWPSCLLHTHRAPIWLLLMTTLAEVCVTKISLATLTILSIICNMWKQLWFFIISCPTGNWARPFYANIPWSWGHFDIRLSSVTYLKS